MYTIIALLSIFYENMVDLIGVISRKERNYR